MMTLVLTMLMTHGACSVCEPLHVQPRMTVRQQRCTVCTDQHFSNLFRSFSILFRFTSFLLLVPSLIIVFRAHRKHPAPGRVTSSWPRVSYLASGVRWRQERILVPLRITAHSSQPKTSLWSYDGKSACRIWPVSSRADGIAALSAHQVLQEDLGDNHGDPQGVYAPESGKGREVAHLGHFPAGGQVECHAQGDEGLRSPSHSFSSLLFSSLLFSSRLFSSLLFSSLLFSSLLFSSLLFSSLLVPFLF